MGISLRNGPGIIVTAFRVLCGLYQGSTRPAKVSACPNHSCFSEEGFLCLLAEMYLGTLGVDRTLFRTLFRALFGLYQGSTRPPECIVRLLNSGIGGVRPYSAAVFTEYS